MGFLSNVVNQTNAGSTTPPANTGSTTNPDTNTPPIETNVSFMEKYKKPIIITSSVVVIAGTLLVVFRKKIFKK